MTQSNDRLDRVKARLDSTVEGLARTEKIVEPNARATEVWGGRIEGGIAEAEAVSNSMAANTNRRMEESITAAPRRRSRALATTAEQAVATVFCYTLGGRYQPQNPDDIKYLESACPV